MQAPQSQTVVITCPNCGTRYQVAPDALGSAGRKVSCAECGTAWLAKPTPPAPEPPPAPPPVAPEDEDRLDAAFEAEEEELAAEEQLSEALSGDEDEADTTANQPPAAPSSARAQKKAEGRFRRRQRQVESQLPVARLRRVVRAGAFAALAATVAGLYLYRVDVVRLVPNLASFYAALGLPVNVVGLDFTDVSTLMARRDGVDVLAIGGTIYPTSGMAQVPPVLVDIRDAHDQVLYQWSVTPRVRSLAPGESTRFSAELASPPAGATSVHLSFATGSGGTASAAAAPAASHSSQDDTAGH